MAAFGATIGSANASVSATTLAMTTSAAVPAGAKIIVFVWNFDAVQTDSGVADGGATLTFVREGRQPNGSFRLAIYYADAPAGLASGATITASYGTGSGDRSIAAYYITAVATGAAGETFSGSNTGTGSTWQSGSKITTNANVILCAGGGEDGSGTAASTPTDVNYTEVHDTPSAASSEAWTTQYRVVSATGTYTAGGSWSPTGSISHGAIVGYVDSGGTASIPPANKAFNPVPFMSNGRL